MAKNNRNGDKEQARGGKRATQGTGAAVAEPDPLSRDEEARPQLREDASLGRGTELPNAPVGEGPSDDEIARRAYELYLERGGTGDGEDLQDWLRAEEELTRERTRP
jgi:hypothetical protein